VVEGAKVEATTVVTGAAVVGASVVSVASPDESVDVHAAALRHTAASSVGTCRPRIP
jgi:hypothetical protein